MTNPTELEPRERNRFMMAKIRAGEPAPYQEGAYVLRVMSVPGRRTGQPQPVPIAISTVEAERYVCAPNRRRDWVLNLLAAEKCEVEGDRVPQCEAVLVEDETAALVVHTYLARLGRPSAEWPFASDAPVSEIAKHLTEIAVFRLRPITG